MRKSYEIIKPEGEALPECENRARALAESTPDAIFIIDTADKIEFVNSSGARYLGKQREEIIGRNRSEFFSPSFADQRKHYIRKVLETGVPQIEEFIFPAKGGELWLNTTSMPLRDKSGNIKAVLSIARDITDRKRIERALHESVEQHRKLFEHASQGIVLADAANGEILDFNRAFSLLSEYDRLELVGKLLSVLHPKKEWNFLLSQTMSQHQDERESAVLPAEIVTKSGKVKQVEIKANVLEIEGREVLYGFYRDVTAELLSKHEGEATLKLLQLLNECSDTHELIRDLIVFIHKWTGFDAIGSRLRDGDDFPCFETRGFPVECERTKDYPCLRDEAGRVRVDSNGNPLLNCMCGNMLCGHSNPVRPFFTPRGSFWTNSTSELLAGMSEADRVAQRLDRCIGGGYESVALVPLRHGGRTLGLLRFNDRAKGRFSYEMITFLENAADQIAIALMQRQTQAALHESEKQFRAIFELASVGMAQADPTTGKLLSVNEKMCAVTGYSADELIGKRISEITFPEDRLPDWEAFQRVVRGEAPDYRMEKRYVRKDGNLVWVNVNMTVLRDATGQPTRTIAAIEDITERKRAEEEKKTMEAQLIKAQKMESVGQLAGGVAHDFNNMLSVIIGNTELAMSHVDPEGPLHHDLQEILDAGLRSADLTRQLLAFARKQSISPKVLDLNDTIESMLKMLRHLVSEDIQLSWNPGHQLWKVKADPSQIDQILANLVVNARDAIAGVGKVFIETANVATDSLDCTDHIGSVPGEYVTLTISDSGTGMDKDVLEHIFEPFFTTKEMGKGTGLGLATVYGIVRQNSGFIEVSSEPGKGTIFRIFLPRTRASAEQIRGEGGSKRVRGGMETILLVEDSPPLVDLGQKILEGLGYTVFAASSPQQAMEIAREHAGDIHLLITDVVMPEMNGRELAEKLAVSRLGMKCLYMSGYTADVIAHQGILNEGVRLIQKPFKREEFAATIREVLDST